MTVATDRKSRGMTWVLLVEPTTALAERLRSWLTEVGARVIVTRSTEETLELLHDAVQIGWSFDALVLGPNVDAAAGRSILTEFQLEYPWVPATWISREPFALDTPWTGVAAIRILPMPECSDDMEPCLWQVEAAAVNSLR